MFLSLLFPYSEYEFHLSLPRSFIFSLFFLSLDFFSLDRFFSLEFMKLETHLLWLVWWFYPRNLIDERHPIFDPILSKVLIWIWFWFSYELELIIYWIIGSEEYSQDLSIHSFSILWKISIKILHDLWNYILKRK